MSLPVLIIHATGTNRDAEAARACELAGASPHIVHVNQLRTGSRRFSDFGMLILPGGFSYGDALGAGVRQALDFRVFFHDELTKFHRLWQTRLGHLQRLPNSGQSRPSARTRSQQQTS